MSDGALQALAWSAVNEAAAPVCAAIRVLTLLTFGGLMIGAAVPWRFRVAFSGLMGWAVSGTGVLPPDVIAESIGLIAVSEVATGAAMGVAVGGLLLGLKLAGDLLDDRLRLTEATGEQMAAAGEEAGPCVRLLGGLAIVLVLFGGAAGDMPVLEGVLASFQYIPAGTSLAALSEWRGVAGVLDGALELAIRTALPVLGAVSIIDWCQMLVARAAPTAPSAQAATAVKPLLGLAVLVASFGGVCETAVVAVRACLESGGAG